MDNNDFLNTGRQNIDVPGELTSVTSTTSSAKLPGVLAITLVLCGGAGGGLGGLSTCKLVSTSISEFSVKALISLSLPAKPGRRIETGVAVRVSTLGTTGTTGTTGGGGGAGRGYLGFRPRFLGTCGTGGGAGSGINSGVGEATDGVLRCLR